MGTISDAFSVMGSEIGGGMARAMVGNGRADEKVVGEEAATASLNSLVYKV